MITDSPYKLESAEHDLQNAARVNRTVGVSAEKGLTKREAATVLEELGYLPAGFEEADFNEQQMAH
jgi:hypothetical protein